MASDLPPGFKMTELGPLPEEWNIINLDEIAQITSGGSAPQGDYYFKGTNPFVRVQHIDLDRDGVLRWDLITDEAVKKYKLKLFPKGTIVFPKSGASIKLEKKAMLSIDSYLVSHLCAVLPILTKADSLFLFYALRSIQLAKDKKDGYPTLKLTEIKNISIPLPPLPEQRAIAYILRTVQEAKEKTEEVIRATRELKKSMTKHLFTYGPIPVDEAENVKLKDTEIGPIPEYWEVVKLGAVISLLRNGLTKQQNRDGKGIPVTRIETISNEVIEPMNVGYLEGISEEEIERFKIREGDILINHINSEKHLGKSAIYKGIPALILHGMNLLLIRVNKKKCEASYLNSLFKFYRLKGVFVGLAARAVGQASINQGKMRSITISLPPLSEQKAIAEILSTIDRKIESEESYKKSLDELFKTLLENLMTGRIRVVDKYKEEEEVEEKKISRRGATKEFKDAVLISYIINRLFNIRKQYISRFQYQKIRYLYFRKKGLEEEISEYERKAAGPYDRKTRYKGPEKIALSSKYLSISGNNKFKPAENITRGINYAPRYFDTYTLNNLIEILKDASDDFLELITSVDETYHKLIDRDIPVTPESILQDWKDDKDSEWSRKANKFSVKNVEDALKFLRKNIYKVYK